MVTTQGIDMSGVYFQKVLSRLEKLSSAKRGTYNHFPNWKNYMIDKLNRKLYYCFFKMCRKYSFGNSMVLPPGSDPSGTQSKLVCEFKTPK